MTEPWRDTQHLVHRMQDQVEEVRSSPRPETSPSEPPIGVADGLDGRLHVEVTGGRISELTLDRRVMRMQSEELAAAIVKAVNAAIEDMTSQAAATVPEAPSMDEMSRTLAEISADSFRAMNEATEGIHRSMDAVRRISELHRRSK